MSNRFDYPWLSPLSWIYAGVTAVRNILFDSRVLLAYRSSLPVVSVGNSTVGGSGKSPVTSMLAIDLLKHGLRPVVLSRGYGGSTAGPHVVTASDTAAEVGDEAVMHREHLTAEIPVVVSRRRVSGVKLIERESLGNIVLLDDGMQHRWLARDFELMIVDVSTADAKRIWFEGRHLPAGPYREQLSPALKRTSAVLFIERTSDPSSHTPDISLYRQLPVDLPYFHILITPAGFVDLFSKQKLEAVPTAGSAVTAIAAPEDFFAMLEKSGIELSSRRAFADHYQFTKKDWKSFLGEQSGPIFVTAKDATKLKSFVERAGQVLVMEIAGQFANSSQEHGFYQLLEGVLKQTAQRLDRSNEGMNS